MDETLPELFSSRIRAAVLGHVLPRPHLAFSLTDLSRALGLPISSLQHECYKLERIGILTGQRRGNAYLYRPDRSMPLIAPLTRLVAVGLGEYPALIGALDGVPGLEIGFLARALPSEGISALAPAPLVLVGDISLEAIDGIQARVALVLGVPPDAIETVYYHPDDWASRQASRSAYVLSLLSGPRTDLAGAGGRQASEVPA